jgi:hypothetical protein
MEKVYHVIKTDSGIITDRNFWERIKSAQINCLPWDVNGYRPKAEAKVVYSSKGLHFYLRAFEVDPRVTYARTNENVFEDSCLEVFINPMPENSQLYMNFEFNAIGATLFSIGKDRYQRQFFSEEDLSMLEIQTITSLQKEIECHCTFWGISFTIPHLFLTKHYENVTFDSGKTMRANFYKCGDKTQYPHYCCWNRIDKEQPDFHTPFFFGRLILL